MKILVLGINYWPEVTGTAPFATGRSEYLAAQGHQVTVCTAFPYYPEWRIADGYRGRIVVRESHGGVSILRSWLYVPKKVGSVGRILSEASFIAGSFLRALGCWKPDLLFVYSPPLGLATSAYALSRLWRIPYVFHVTDLQPDAAVDLGMLRTGRLTSALYALERFAYRKAAIVSTLTESMRQQILSKGIAPDKAVIFADWSEPSLFELPLNRGGKKLRQEFGLEDKFLVVHAGNMGVKQGLEVILGAAARTRELAEVVYLLVGDGAMRERLEGRARASNLSNLRFIPLLPREKFLEMLTAVDVSLVTQQKTVGDIVFPSKVRTILPVAAPLVASLNRGSEVARVVLEAGAGLVTPAEDPDALAQAVIELRFDPERRELMRERGRNYARLHWERDRILAEMEERLLQLTSRKSWTSESARKDLRTEKGAFK